MGVIIGAVTVLSALLLLLALPGVFDDLSDGVSWLRERFSTQALTLAGASVLAISLAFLLHEIRNNESQLRREVAGLWLLCAIASGTAVVLATDDLDNPRIADDSGAGKRKAFEKREGQATAPAGANKARRTGEQGERPVDGSLALGSSGTEPVALPGTSPSTGAEVPAELPTERSPAPSPVPPAPSSPSRTVAKVTLQSESSSNSFSESSEGGSASGASEVSSKAVGEAGFDRR